MVDIAVKSGAAWVCRTQGRGLADVLLAVHISNKDDIEKDLSSSEEDEANWRDPVLLEQTAEDSPCVLTLHCSPCSHTVISRLLVISEARTMEVYSQNRDYCGTVRGNVHHRIQPDNSERGPFYKKQLILEHPASACELKLLSLAGRKSVLVCGVVVGLQQLQPCLARGPGIDMQKVQCLVEEMGTSLSPGAQNLMEMVRFQQKNQANSLANFLPLLMSSGGFSALTQRTNISPVAIRNPLQPAESRPLVNAIRSTAEAPLAQNGAVSKSCTSSSPGPPVSGSSAENIPSHAQLAEMMSHFLHGQGDHQALTSSPELLPMLQSVCGQVTKLRLDDFTALAEKEGEMRNGTWELDSAMEQRLAEMETRLREYVDRRLDALEQKLERSLQRVLPQFALSHGATSSAAGEAAFSGASEPASSSAASH